jgi:glycosyltransferase involved in cell wall biosynthesis
LTTPPTPDPDLDLSVLIPVHDEEGNLAPLVAELIATLDALPELTWEVILVDDGSRDGSPEVLAELARDHPLHVRTISLRRNYGQTAALDAGIRHARGRVLVPMDADGQNDPADIPRLLAEVARGADVVSGWRRRRHDAFLSRRVPSILANGLISRATGVRVHDFGCTLKAYRREYLEGVRLYGEMHRFLVAYAAWSGARVVELEVNHRPRERGRSKYGISRTPKVLLDLLTVLFLQTGYVSRPLHVFGGFGMLMVFTALALAGYVGWEKLQFPVGHPDHIFVHRNPLASLSAMIMILGAGAVALGLVAELLARVYHQSAGTPYQISGGRNLPSLQTPEEARALPPGIARLAQESASSPEGVDP